MYADDCASSVRVEGCTLRNSSGPFFARCVAQEAMRFCASLPLLSYRPLCAASPVSPPLHTPLAQ